MLGGGYGAPQVSRAWSPLDLRCPTADDVSMGSMRFRRSVRIAPGLRLNVNKRSVGLSAGTRGARVSVNSDGRSTRSVGIPGTGLYYRSQTGLIWVFGGFVDTLVFAWFRRSRKSAVALAPSPVVGRVEQAIPASRPPPSGSHEDEVELSPANVEPNWREGQAWLAWEAPRNFVAGESHYMPALRELAGEPRQNGYLIPAEVVFVREPTNRYDSNAWRAEVEGRHIGYAARHIAAQLTQGFDPFRLSSFTVCGVLRGGSLDAPNIGVHIWPDRRPCPGPEIRQVDDALAVSWPPSPGEGAYCSHDEEQLVQSGTSGKAERRPAADMFDAYLQHGRETMDAGGPEDRVLDALKAATDIAAANENTDQKEAAAGLAERLMGYARGTKTLAQAARIKKRLEPKLRSAKQAGKGVEERLVELNDLHKRGVITEDEYAAQRAAIIKQV